MSATGSPEELPEPAPQTLRYPELRTGAILLWALLFWTPPAIGVLVGIPELLSGSDTPALEVLGIVGLLGVVFVPPGLLALDAFASRLWTISTDPERLVLERLRTRHEIPFERIRAVTHDEYGLPLLPTHLVVHTDDGRRLRINKEHEGYASLYWTLRRHAPGACEGALRVTQPPRTIRKSARRRRAEWGVVLALELLFVGGAVASATGSSGRMPPAYAAALFAGAGLLVLAVAGGAWLFTRQRLVLEEDGLRQVTPAQVTEERTPLASLSRLRLVWGREVVGENGARSRVWKLLGESSSGEVLLEVRLGELELPIEELWFALRHLLGAGGAVTAPFVWERGAEATPPSGSSEAPTSSEARRTASVARRRP